MDTLQVLFTGCSLIALCGCVWAFLRAQWHADEAAAADRTTHECVALLRAERDRVTVSERDIAALRRELRKLAGSFYAARRELPDDDKQPAEMTNITAPHCDNYAEAQKLGPQSPAAACGCSYCDAMRERKRRARDAMIPKTARGQGELAKLNAGKP